MLILKSKKIKNNFGELVGEKVPTAPRGFKVNHPGIDLLRHKQFVIKFNRLRFHGNKLQ